MAQTLPDDNELKKIDLPTEVPEKTQHMKQKSSRGGMIVKSLVMVVTVFLLIFGAGAIIAYLKVGIPARRIYEKAQLAAQTGRELAAAAKNQNIEESKKKIGELRTRLNEVKTAYYKDFLWLKSFPIIKNYIADGEHGFNAAFAGLDAGDKAIAALEPNADLLGLKGKSNFLAGSADERIQLAVKTMKALIPKINDMAKDIDTLRIELNQIDPNRYPEEIRGDRKSVV